MEECPGTSDDPALCDIIIRASRACFGFMHLQNPLSEEELRARYEQNYRQKLACCDAWAAGIASVNVETSRLKAELRERRRLLLSDDGSQGNPGLADNPGEGGSAGRSSVSAPDDADEGPSTRRPHDNALYESKEEAHLRQLELAILRQKRRKAVAKKCLATAEATLRRLQQVGGAEESKIAAATSEHAEAAAELDAASRRHLLLRRQKRTVKSLMGHDQRVPLRDADAGAEGVILRFQKLGIPISRQETTVPWHTRRQFATLKHLRPDFDTVGCPGASPAAPSVMQPATPPASHTPAPKSPGNYVMSTAAETLEHDASSCPAGTGVCIERARREPSSRGSEPCRVRTAPLANRPSQFGSSTARRGSQSNEEENLVETVSTPGDGSALSPAVTGKARAPRHMARTTGCGGMMQAARSSFPGPATSTAHSPQLSDDVMWSLDAGSSMSPSGCEADGLTRGSSHTTELQPQSVPWRAAAVEPTGRSAEGLVEPDLRARTPPTAAAVLQSAGSPMPDDTLPVAVCESQTEEFPSEAPHVGEAVAHVWQAGPQSGSPALRLLGSPEKQEGVCPTPPSSAGLEWAPLAAGQEVELAPEARARLSTTAEAKQEGKYLSSGASEPRLHKDTDTPQAGWPLPSWILKHRQCPSLMRNSHLSTEVVGIRETLAPLTVTWGSGNELPLERHGDAQPELRCLRVGWTQTQEPVSTA
ncbi:hypothetical protein BESB_028530 [Besnoitia besnoiti]|uniref:Uncharacterized protein n=1 Tax=Besnoitia besnoiti TaxID=94643 RepID=A0A2A9LY88_BESBE|nr:uncharacterized protein BESB_028530 [Besnoitia besnoiti]PFH31418.1 hypothetical protein BESB_028530 [Besnoitia besnoiti]